MSNYSIKKQRIAFILDKVPAARTDKKLLMVTYWKLFNEIEIPDEVAQNIITKADEPETIMRLARQVIKEAREAAS